MDQTFLRTRLNNFSVLALLVVVLIFLVLPGIPASNTAALKTTAGANMQIPHPWTEVGSTGSVDESSLSAFAVSGSSLGFSSTTSATSLVARYNVTNTFDNNIDPNKPGWVQMEMTGLSPANTSVTAKLFKVNKCTGTATHICTASNVGGGGPSCSFCQFPLGTIDFTNDLYFVEVSLTRQSAAASPRLYALRIY